jgi:recombination protein RecA
MLKHRTSDRLADRSLAALWISPFAPGSQIGEDKAKTVLMPSAAALRLSIESALSARIPSALTPAPRLIRPTAPTGIAALDERLDGGLPVGALSELTGPECSGRTSLALSFIVGLTEAGRVCAWVDVSDALDPESAAAIGVDLDRLLWVRCGVQPQQQTLPGFVAARQSPKAWSRLDQALRVTDLLLQAGGFSAIVLDVGSVAPEFALRIPLATWFRYRAAAERTQASVLLLTQHACSKSSAGLVLTLTPSGIASEGATVLTGAEYRVAIARERFAAVNPFARKPPQSETCVRWNSQQPWAGRR